MNHNQYHEKRRARVRWNVAAYAFQELIMRWWRDTYTSKPTWACAARRKWRTQGTDTDQSRGQTKSGTRRREASGARPPLPRGQPTSSLPLQPPHTPGQTYLSTGSTKRTTEKLGTESQEPRKRKREGSIHTLQNTGHRWREETDEETCQHSVTSTELGRDVVRRYWGVNFFVCPGHGNNKQ
jgi:hypothetical protein